MAGQKKLKVVVGLTGPMAGGKGTVADFILKKGFIATSLSDRLREHFAKIGVDRPTREQLQDLADRWRREIGPEVLARKTWHLIGEKGFEKVVIQAIRGEAEVDYLKKKEGFVLVGVTAPQKMRFSRIVKRKRSGDPVVWKEFLRLDKKDLKSGSGLRGRDIKSCLKKADILINNNGSFGELREKVKKVINEVSG